MNSNYRLETTRKIKRNKAKLENKLKVDLEIKLRQIKIKGKELDIYVAEKVLDAIEKSFPIDVALLLTEEDYVLEVLPIKSITKRKNMSVIRSRIIGTRGKTLKTLSNLTDCHITLHDNTVNIIGDTDKIKDTINAIENLIRGSKQANVYSFLEKCKRKHLPTGLGLKE